MSDYKEIEDPEAPFVERVEALISRENTMWLTTHRPKAKEEESRN